jgi:hypothetical protein
MQKFPQNLIFTVCTGRCGQHSLGDYLNRYAFDTFAEVEPPNLVYPSHFPFGNLMRDIQRKWIVTEEMLGRGKALDWYKSDDTDALRRLASKRLKRIERLCVKNQCQNYFEISKFFIRSYFAATQDLKPNIGVLLLRRDPMSNAKSFANRGKKFTLDNQTPNEHNVILKMNPEKLSRFQLYLWQWCEVELRYRKFIEEKQIVRHFELSNLDLANPQKLCDMLDCFSINHADIADMVPHNPINTNIQNGFQQTKLTKKDFKEFVKFVEMLPPKIYDTLPLIDDWFSKYKTAEFID